MSWTTQYRPQHISELALTSVKETFSHWLKEGWIPQVLLFAGPKGTGKTTAARLLAAVLNDPANAAAVQKAYFQTSGKRQSFQEADSTNSELRAVLQGESFAVIEIDAASHRGIDNIRELKNQIQLAPALGLMTICILDEAHMLTKEAWNAFLKVLEEPPQHVVFVLATTELHKIPATIQSRCQVVQFTKATESEILSTLHRVSQQESISLSAEDLVNIAKKSDGSFRDAIKLLERANLEKNQQTESISDPDLLTDITIVITSIVLKKEADVITCFANLRIAGVDERYFHAQLLQILHQYLIRCIVDHTSIVLSSQVSLNQAALEFLLNEFQDSQLSVNSFIPFLPLELKSLEIIRRAKTGRSGSSTQKKVSASEAYKVDEKPKVTENKSSDTPFPQTQQSDETISTSIAPNEVISQAGEIEKVISAWQEFAALIHQQNQTVAAVVQSSLPQKISDHSMQLLLSHQFHVERLKQPRIKTIIESAAAQLAQGPVQIEAIMVPSTSNSETDNKAMTVLAAEALL